MKQTNTVASSVDKIRYLMAILVLVASLVVYYWMSDLPLYARVMVILLGVGASVGILWTSLFGVNARKHLHDTQREVRQVVWPTRQQAIRMTLIIFAAVFVVGLFLWVVDMFFLWGVQWLTGAGSK